MKYLIIVIQVALIYLFFMVGTFLSEILRLPIHGSITGLLLLFLCLNFNILPEKYIQSGAGFMLAFMPVFFIPSTVGVIQYPEFLSLKGIILVLIVMISSFITILVAGKTSQYFEKKTLLKEE